MDDESIILMGIARSGKVPQGYEYERYVSKETKKHIERLIAEGKLKREYDD